MTELLSRLLQSVLLCVFAADPSTACVEAGIPKSPYWALAEKNMTDGGMDRKGKGETGLMEGREIRRRHAVTH